jgi:hypothetical protein
LDDIRKTARTDFVAFLGESSMTWNIDRRSRIFQRRSSQSGWIQHENRSGGEFDRDRTERGERRIACRRPVIDQTSIMT